MLENLSLPAWILKNRIVTESGKPLDLASHLFLFDIYADQHPKQVIMKGAQVGASTLQILKMFWMAKMRGLSLAYVLPTYSDAVEFTATKVNKIIQANPILRSYVEDGDTLGYKRCGNANIFIRGSFAEKQAISFSADAIFFDEVDRSDQNVQAVYASRLQHSHWKGENYFSNPSVPGNGVSKYWETSDQRHWFIRCPKCSKEQYLDWPESIDLDRRCFQCKMCSAELSSEDRRRGRWVKRFNDREFHGYWISLLMAPWVSADEIIKYNDDKSAEYFANFVLGKPYVGQGNTISPEMFFRNCTNKINSQEEVVIGADSGLVKHFCVGNREGLFYYGKSDSWDAIESLLSRFPRSVAVIDALPDLGEPRKLREKYPGRVFLAHYVRDRKTLQFIKWGEHEEMGNVNIDRNRLIQIVVDELADGRIPIQGTRDDWSEFYTHLKSMYRMEQKDAQGNPWQVWESSDGKDHWLHSLVYWRAGMDRYGQGKAKIVTQPMGFSQAQKGFAVDIDGTSTMPDPKNVFKMKQGTDWRS